MRRCRMTAVAAEAAVVVDNSRETSEGDRLGGGEWLIWCWWRYMSPLKCVAKWGVREARKGV